MSALRLFLIVSVLATSAACGGDKGRATGETTPTVEDPTETAGDVVDDSLTADECKDLMDHVLKLSIAEKRDKSPNDVPTDEERSAIRAELHGEIPRCEREVTRREFDCAMGASTTADFEACAR